MRILNVTPRNERLKNGSTVLARFDLEPADGIVCTLSLVRAARDGADLIWSVRGPGGPAVRIGAAARADLAARVKSELAAMAIVLRDAA